jgi:hypothetical protein
MFFAKKKKERKGMLWNTPLSVAKPGLSPRGLFPFFFYLQLLILHCLLQK